MSWGGKFKSKSEDDGRELEEESRDKSGKDGMVKEPVHMEVLVRVGKMLREIGWNVKKEQPSELSLEGC